jgi:hypothetical protein
MLLFLLNLLLTFVAVVVALRFGDKLERYGAFIILIMSSISYGRILLIPPGYTNLDQIALAEDLFGFVAFSAIGIYFKKVWPLWAAALQLLSVGAHFVRVLELPVRPIVYAWMKSGPTWAVLVILIFATILCRRETSVRASARFSQN